jgi:hypothetical protein
MQCKEHELKVKCKQRQQEDYLRRLAGGHGAALQRLWMQLAAGMNQLLHCRYSPNQSRLLATNATSCIRYLKKLIYRNSTVLKISKKNGPSYERKNTAYNNNNRIFGRQQHARFGSEDLLSTAYFFLGSVI